MSPIRLYIIACKAAVLASERVLHQLIRRKERNPTPSQPMRSWNRLLEEIRIIIAKRKIVNKRVNRFKFRSLDM